MKQTWKIICILNNDLYLQDCIGRWEASFQKQSSLLCHHIIMLPTCWWASKIWREVWVRYIYQYIMFKYRCISFAYPSSEGIWESRGVTPLILDLGTKWWWTVNFTTWLLYPCKRIAVGSRAGLDVVEKKKVSCSLYWLHYSSFNTFITNTSL